VSFISLPNPSYKVDVCENAGAMNRGVIFIKYIFGIVELNYLRLSNALNKSPKLYREQKICLSIREIIINLKSPIISEIFVSCIKLK